MADTETFRLREKLNGIKAFVDKGERPMIDQND